MVSVNSMMKAKAYNMYIVPESAYCSSTFCHRESRLTVYAAVQACVYGLWPATIRSPGLPFVFTPVLSPYKYMDYYSFTDPAGMEGWVGLVDWPI